MTTTAVETLWTWDSPRTWDSADIAWDETYKTSFFTSLDDAVHFMDKMVKKGCTTIQDSFQCDEDGTRKAKSNRVFPCTVHVSTSATKDVYFTRRWNDLLGVKDETTRKTTFERSFSEPIVVFIEKYFDYQNFLQFITENISVSEHKASQVASLLKEQLRTAEGFRKVLCMYRTIQDSFQCDEDGTRKAKAFRTVREHIDVLAGIYKKQLIKFEELLSAIEQHQRSIHTVQKEDLNIQDVFDRYFLVLRTYVETIGAIENSKRDVDTKKKEVLVAEDAFVENANAVISNIVFFSEEMDKQMFLSQGLAPGGYGSFQDFYVGDYEYQKALLRICLKTNQLNNAPSLTNVVFNVDIPDTDDRGMATITDTSKPAKIYFNKVYYNPPEVSITLKGGNTANGVIIPNIVRLDGQDNTGRYFECELLNVYGERVSGSIVWVAKGY